MLKSLYGNINSNKEHLFLGVYKSNIPIKWYNIWNKSCN